MRRLRRLRREAGPLALTAGLVALTWSLTYRIWAPSDFTHPIEYYGDGNLQLGVVQASSDRGWGSLTGAEDPWVGAPGAARWTDFPLSEDVVYLGLGFLSRLTGVIAALNLGFLGAGVLAAAVMYLVARRLRIPPPLASLAGGLYAVAPYFFYRNIPHFNLIIFWHLPLCMLVMSWTLSRRGLRLGERRLKLACAITALCGVHCNYYTNYVMQVLLLAAVLQALRRNWKGLRATLVIMGAGLFTLVLANLDTVAVNLRFGANLGVVARSAGDTLMYGLRPLELFVPSYLHRLGALAHLGARYQASAPMLGEFPSNFLGVVPAIGFVSMVLAGFGAALGTGRRGAATRFLIITVWLVLVSIGGGLMQLAQMILGVVAFRSNNRVSIILLGLAVLYLGRALAPALRRLPSKVAWGLVLPVIVFGMWEQSPDLSKKLVYGNGLNHWQMRERWARAAESDERFVAELERSLPAGAGVLQLPAFAFPENGPIGPIYDYEHFRLYAFSHQKLRWSYGAMKGRPDGSFQQEVAQLPPLQMVARLREAGFGAVVFANQVYAAGTADRFAQEVGAGARVTNAENRDWSAVVFASP